MKDVTINQQWELKLPEHRVKAWEHDWERERLDHMHATTHPGDKVLYIGAEEGDMPALLSSWGAELFMVEPAPRVWANIKAIWDANNLNPPKGCYVGFCGEDNSVNWVNGWNTDWPSCAFGDVIEDHSFPSLISVGDQAVTTIDAIADKFPPNMISIDVEGSEYRVLKGAVNTLETHRPRIYLSLHPEFLFHQEGIYGEEVRNMIRDKGYHETLISYPHEVHLYYEPM